MHQRRIRHLLQEDLVKGEFDENTPPSDLDGAIFHYLTAIEGNAPAEAAARLALSDAQLRHYVEGAKSAVMPRDVVEAFAIRASLPRWLAEHLVREWPQAAPALAAAFNRPGPIAFRARTRGGRRALAARLAGEGIATRPGRIAPDALLAFGRPNIRGSTAYRDFDFEVQDEASQLVALATGARPGDDVWDVCAGRGGKSLALASMLHGRGHILATDIDASALKDFRARLVRRPATTIELFHLDDTQLPSVLAAIEARPQFDVVLVDAPCSSLGTLRRSPDRRWTTPASAIQTFAALQRTILWDAAARVKRGGSLVYATCTLARAENDDVADAFLLAHADFVAAPLAQTLGAPVARRISVDGHRATLRPDVHNTDGFFIARFLRR